ncbi:Mitochondrial inner membrane translocase subunit Tim17/Tim22/Tim23/peroxisomal protein PMP24 [Cynara cardunculus var. scolymus]|uniref:Mitochondrial inner membrane translocase subunit Tim17/Tim22/Tim23/peroxisomal protein PMP24 n=1 Tax=Cynara cardunculus var. scolymus TaxID=59895 RepID=A0A124SBC3_CYNCS|nr:Mitochondrial inner membrane translocase subunit Tim17/Tim22/Tim23/peroxisomal protein PMP24 [Cynara cardunculus var. scolymus]
MGHNLETRSLLDELRSFDKNGGIFDLGHPLLNRMAESFVKAAGIGAVQAVSREAYFTAFEENLLKHWSKARGKNLYNGVKTCVLVHGLAAGMYSGITYGLKEARGVHDWKNSAVAGAITGAALALTFDDSSHEQIVHGAITGAALSTAANLLTGIF